MVSELELEWRDVFDDSRNVTLENEVFSALMPHSDYLEDLVIESYGDKVFPNWIGDSKFVRLSGISLSRCRNCTFLPPLGNLPSLKKLLIKDLDEVKDIGSEFVAAGSGPAFPSLESLCFQDMRGWEVWSTTVGGVVGAVFPCLQELTLRNCPNLAVVSLKALPSLRILKIKKCGDGVLRSMVHVASSVTKLIISGISRLSDEVWREVMEHLGTVEEVRIQKCNEIQHLWESEAKASNVLVNLRKLKVRDCEELVSLGEKENDVRAWVNHLTSLTIYGCKKLEHCSCPNSIEELKIDCSSITYVSFPEGGCQKLKSLTIWECNELVGKGLEKMFLSTTMPMLQEVGITGWEILNKMIGLACFDHVTSLTITSFQGIDSFGHWPPRLHTLQIYGLKKPNSQCGPHNFPTTLVDLTLGVNSTEEDDVTCATQLSHILPKSLTTLSLQNFEKLETVSKGLQHLTSLQHLYIWGCPKMKDLPETLLPSLLSLSIDECTDELKEKTSRRGSYRPLISYIPSVIIL